MQKVDTLDVPFDAIERRQDQLERLVEADLPVSDYASELLALIETEEKKR